MEQPWKRLQGGKSASCCALSAWDKVTSGSKDSLGDISPELQYLPRKQNSGFLCVSIEHNEMNQE